jgi:ABC-type sugar transport system permease subunit
MFTSPQWIAALERTLAFTVVTIVVDIVAALGLAVMLNRKFIGRGLVRASILVPWAVPAVVSALLWKTMFDPRAGFVDYFLGGIHPAWANLTWLNASVWRSWIVIFVADSWKNIPFVAIILLAGLQVIPTEVYEAARIDGATGWQAFRRVTLPLLKPQLLHLHRQHRLRRRRRDLDHPRDHGADRGRRIRQVLQDGDLRWPSRAAPHPGRQT